MKGKKEKENEGEDICCVCGHKLSAHIDEGDGWRCHALGPDAYQCECFLRKDRVEGNITEYSLEQRTAQHKKEYDEG